MLTSKDFTINNLPGEANFELICNAATPLNRNIPKKMAVINDRPIVTWGDGSESKSVSLAFEAAKDWGAELLSLRPDKGFRPDTIQFADGSYISLPL